jgi:hypothetical protein
MSTLRQVIMANIAGAEAAAQKFREDLARLEKKDASILERDLTELREHITDVCNHLYSKKGNDIAQEDEVKKLTDSAKAVAARAVPIPHIVGGTDTIVGGPAIGSVDKEIAPGAIVHRIGPETPGADGGGPTAASQAGDQSTAGTGEDTAA